MPRKARIDAPGALHHIMLRGIERRRKFSGDRDRGDFIERLGDIVTGTKTFCFGWALVPNHGYILLRTGNIPLCFALKKSLDAAEQSQEPTRGMDQMGKTVRFCVHTVLARKASAHRLSLTRRSISKE